MSNQPKKVPMNELSPLLLGLINDGTDVTFTVTGQSMQPTFYNLRDTVVLTKCDPLTLKKGQIPMYLRENGQHVLHRIVKVHKDTYDMCGDHQYEIEYGVPKSAVLCVAKSFTHKGKLISCNNLFYKIYSFLWCLCIPFRRYVFAVHRRLRKIFGGKK
jgi:hypothetical protein